MEPEFSSQISFAYDSTICNFISLFIMKRSKKVHYHIKSEHYQSDCNNCKNKLSIELKSLISEVGKKRSGRGKN